MLHEAESSKCVADGRDGSSVGETLVAALGLTEDARSAQAVHDEMAAASRSRHGRWVRHRAAQYIDERCEGLVDRYSFVIGIAGVKGSQYDDGPIQAITTYMP